MGNKLYRAVGALLIATNILGECARVAYAAETEDVIVDGSEEIPEDYDSSEENDSDAIDEEAFSDDSDITEVSPESEATIVGEIIEKRSEYSKQYLMSDDSRCVVLYYEPVHYEEEDGSFVEIDNSVIATSEGYENADNTYHVLFTDSEESQGEVRFTEDDYSINWEYLDGSEEEPDTEREETQEEAKLDVSVENEPVIPEEEDTGHVINSSTVSFDGYEDGIKLEYSPVSAGIKENIVLPDRSAGNSFTFKIELQGLKARVTGTNEVELYDEDTDEVKYYIPAPFMEDSDGSFSEDVWYSVSDKMPVEWDKSEEAEDDDVNAQIQEDASSESDSVPDTDEVIISETEIEISSEEAADEISTEGAPDSEEPITPKEAVDSIPDPAKDIEDNPEIDDQTSVGGSIYLTVTADKEWLDSAAYPVTIDPMIKKVKNSIDIDCGSICNTFLCNGNDACHGSMSNLVVGNENGNIYRTCIQFDLPAIEKGSVITDAGFYLSGEEGKDHYILAKEITSKWSFKNDDIDSLFWSQENTDTNPEFYGGKTIDFAVNGSYFNLTKLVRKWYAGDDNNGFVLMARDEGKSKKDTISISKKVGRPYFKVSYKNFIGLEEYWGVHKTAVGTAGMGYINDYSGALTVVNTDVHTNGGRMPFNIQHVYNSGFDTDDEWKLSYDEQIIVPVGKVDIKKYPYEYIDEDRTSHYFKASDVTYLENGVKTTAEKSGAQPSAADEDGLKLFIVPVKDKTLKEQYPLKLIDKSSGTVKYFDKAGKLAMISDSNQNENGKNSDKREANRITIELESFGGEKSTETYEGAIECLNRIYEYLVTAGHTIADHTNNKKDVATAKQLLEELLYDAHAKADYQVAVNIQNAYDKLKVFWEEAPDNAGKKKASDESRKALTKAYNRAKLLTLSDERIISVSDAVGNTSYIGYGTDGRITSISDPTENGKINEYSYDENGKLIHIVFSNGRYADYGYDTNGNLSKMVDSSGYRVEYTYDDDRIVEVKESSNGSEGQKYTVSYGDDNTNVFRFSGNNDVHGDDDDILNTYVFDEEGRTITKYSTYDKESKYGREGVLGAESFTYEDNAVKQEIRSSYDDQSAGRYTNLMENPSFESDLDSWNRAVGNDENAKIYETDKYLGKKCLKLCPDTGESALVEQIRYLKPGTYTLSFRIKTDKDQEKIAGIGYTNFGEILTMKYTSREDADKWVIVSSTFKVEGEDDNEREVNIALYAEDGACVLFDCIHLEEGAAAHNYSTTTAVSSTTADADKDDNPNLRNKIKDYAVLGRQTQNLLKNHNFEINDDSWNVYKGGSSVTDDSIVIQNAGKITVKTDTTVKMCYIGRNAVVCNMKKAGKATVGVSQSVRIPENGDYTLSAYVKATGISGAEAYLFAADPDSKRECSERLTAVTVKKFADGWDRLSVSFSATAGDVYTIGAEARGTEASPKGFISFDAIQLEKGKLANQYNILEDGSFELTDSQLPYSWENLVNAEDKDEIIAGGIDGEKCYHITGEPGKNKILKCKVQLGDTTSSYVLSGWIKSDTAPVRKGRELLVKAEHDGSDLEAGSSLVLNDFSSGWKYFSIPMPAHAWGKTKVEIHFFDNIGDLYIDGLQLSRNDVCTKEYNSSGKVTGVCVSERKDSYTYDTYNRLKTLVSPGGVTQTYSYDTSNNLTKVKSDYGPDSYMKYDSYGNQISLSVHEEVTEDESGKKTNQLELYSENTYTDDGNYVRSNIDNCGFETTYEYDEQKGLPKKEIHPEYQDKITDMRIDKKGGDVWILSEVAKWLRRNEKTDTTVKFDYGYDAYDRITEVVRSSGEESRRIDYDYKNSFDLRAIRHNDFEYSYDYDDFGNILSTSIAGEPVQTNEYQPFNGKLEYTRYADGKEVRNKYDIYGNVTNTEITDDDGTRTTDSYQYYNDGKLAVHNDEIAGVSTQYDYNEAGKVCRSSTKRTGKGEEYDSRLQYIYNPLGKVSKLHYGELVDGKENIKSYNYTYYKDGSNKKDTLPDSSYKEFRYDSLRRVNSTIYTSDPKYSENTSKKLYTRVVYEKLPGHAADCIGTTNRVSAYINKIGSSAEKAESHYQYGYDKQGNITGIVLTDKVSTDNMLVSYDRNYAYDAFGEVTEAFEVYSDGSGKLFCYEYDDGGNIRSEVVKNYDGKEFKDEVVRAVDGKDLPGHTYEYASDWKDKLISYDGQQITYDDCGNPTNYLGYEMKWNTINGSLLSANKGTASYKYDYFSDGQRLSKKVNDKKTTYIYNAGMLLAEETPDYRINYYYDADGLIIEIGYQPRENGKYGTENHYFFTRNGQGDVVGIYRCSDMTLVGNYEYDLWGNPVIVRENVITKTVNKKKVEIKDSDGILNKNPIRYRGYYYDAETGFYYLNSRYYDPKVHRFISADTVIAGVSADTNGYNLFAYCNNDPVNQMDSTGEWPQLTNRQKVAVGLAVIAAAAVLTVATAGVGGPVACFAIGALQGSVIGAATGAVSGAAINGGIAFISSGGDLEKTKQAAIDGACDGFMSGSITGFVTGGMTSSHCFVAGTLVETIDGPIPIEQIEEGEFVLSEDPETGDVTYKRVLETYVNETTELIHLNIDGEEILTTPAHPFYVKNIGFVLAGDLEEGTTFVDNEGNELHLLIKRWEQLQNPVPVYNFAVEDYHTYFVGNSIVLVHNDCIPEGGSYGELKGQGGQVHHMPADSVSPLSKSKGPAIRMDTADHLKTASWGRSSEAIKYRELQKQLIDQGKFMEAQLMDIKNIRALFGTQYDDAIEQMLKYTKTLGDLIK